MTILRRYWFKFQPTSTPSVVNVGCGVTAHDYDDALSLLRTTVFVAKIMPAVLEVVEDVIVSELDQKHVIPNMGVVAIRGVWFPKGF